MRQDLGPPRLETGVPPPATACRTPSRCSRYPARLAGTIPNATEARRAVRGKPSAPRRYSGTGSAEAYEQLGGRELTSLYVAEGLSSLRGSAGSAGSGRL